jgi:hypothetical protein
VRSARQLLVLPSSLHSSSRESVAAAAATVVAACRVGSLAPLLAPLPQWSFFLALLTAPPTAPAAAPPAIRVSLLPSLLHAAQPAQLFL